MLKTDTKPQNGNTKPKVVKPQVSAKKYEMLTNKKRKLDDDTKTDLPSEAKRPRILKEKNFENKAPFVKKPFDSTKKPFVKKPFDSISKTFVKKPFDSTKKPFVKKSFDNTNKPFVKKPFDSTSKPFVKNNDNKSDLKKPEVKLTIVEKKELRIKRKKQKLGDNYDTNVNMKKVWETLRRVDTTEEARKKLCTYIFDNVKGKINQMALAHDTCRVIECLVQYGNDRHRTGVFEELKDHLVELSKSKYARFMIKKLLTYCSKEQKDIIIQAFIGHVTKLIKHSFACQAIETIYNEHASYSQRIQMQMEFYDPTFALFNDQRYKTLANIIEAEPFSKDKILENMKKILTSCINKTLLMFSLVHKIFLEYFQNCDSKMRAEMIDLLAEHLVHMLHSKDGTQVALQCVWFGTAKDRKKIIKSLKSFVLKIAMEEHGHMLLLGVLDSVDDTKFISKSILEELFRSTKELFDNEYGRKVITYLIAPRDSRFFLKDYVKRLELGDSSETSKKDPEIRRKELLDYSKSHLKAFLIKDIGNLLFSGAGGILVPIILDQLNEDATEIIKEIANILLEKRYEPVEGGEYKEKVKETESNEDKSKIKKEKKKVKVEGPKLHCVEEATAHFIVKQILTKDTERETKSLLTLGEAILSHTNAIYIRSWIDCNRGCFALAKLIETSTDLNKKKMKLLLEDCDTQLTASKWTGSKTLLEKLEEIK